MWISQGCWHSPPQRVGAYRRLCPLTEDTNTNVILNITCWGSISVKDKRDNWIALISTEVDLSTAENDTLVESNLLLACVVTLRPPRETFLWEIFSRIMVWVGTPRRVISHLLSKKGRPDWTPQSASWGLTYPRWAVVLKPGQRITREKMNRCQKGHVTTTPW